MLLDVRFVDQARRDIAALLAAHPELAEDDILRLDMVEGLTDALGLIDRLIQAEREAKALAQGIDGELDRLKKRQERFEARRTALRKYIMQLLEAAGLKKVERSAATVSISAGKPKVIVTDETLLPDHLVRIKREPNKTAIGEALARGKVPGVTLSNSEPVLRIS